VAVRSLLGSEKELHALSGISEEARTKPARRICIFIRRRYMLCSGFGGIGAMEGRSDGPTRLICAHLNTGFREDLC
jgi:hypothetical protein